MQTLLLNLLNAQRDITVLVQLTLLVQLALLGTTVLSKTNSQSYVLKESSQQLDRVNAKTAQMDTVAFKQMTQLSRQPVLADNIE